MSIVNQDGNKSESSVTVDEQVALAQIREEIRISREYVKDKRVVFRSRLKLYNNQRKQQDKIGDTSIFNVITTMLAIYYSDEIQVSFQGREFGDVPFAQNIENTAKFDYDEMGLDIINFETQWDRFFFGVGIRQCSEWDSVCKTPIAKSLSALSWLPDPKGGMDVKKFRYMGFEVEYTEAEMTEEAGFFNLDRLPKNTTRTGSEKELDRQAYHEAQGLTDVNHQNTSNKGRSYDMVDIITTLEGSDGIRRKYIVTVDDAVKNIFRFEEIEPVTKKEKENPELVPMPISLNYYMPQREDPFGTSIPDLVEDKQRAKSIFKNLRINAEKANIYPMYLYNRDKILNRRDLDFAFNKFIAVRGDVSDNVVRPLNKVNRTNESLTNEASLDADIEISTGASKNAQGVMSEQQRTLGEQEIVQANANLRYLLGSKINAWGERRFWKLWYRLYQQNFPETDAKIIRLQTSIGTQFAKITRKLFITSSDPDIKISSKLETEQKRNLDKLSFTPIAQMLINDPSLPTSSRNFVKRHLLRLNGMSNDLIQVMVPETPDESKARMENELLSKNNTEPEATMQEDHLSHIVIHSQAEKTPATMSHIQVHYNLYIESGQDEQDRAMQKAYLSNNRNNQSGAIAAANAALGQNINNNSPKGIQPAA